MPRKGEKRLSLKQLHAAILREYGVKVSEFTVWRWARVGVQKSYRSAERIKLETRDVGGRIETSLEAYERFERRKGSQ